jgi:ornithine--oxo-acid transaminase
MQSSIELEKRFGAHNYEPLPVVLNKGQGIYVWDTEGNRYIDMMSAYSAVSHGHCHPILVKTLTDQANTLAMVSRAFYTDRLGQFLQKVCEVSGFEKALAMNSGAEAVETALKAVRKWAYQVKKVPENKAEIIVCEGNFHGRTITIVGMSSEAQYREGFGPFPAGFKQIPFNDTAALEKAITPNTAAFLVEPIQGENGIVVPDAGYLKKCQEICRKNNVLMICDEIQTGMGRTGKFLASSHDNFQPDGVLLGKALGGGLLPVSVFLTRAEVMDVFTPGDHGSTFGGNPLAATVGLRAIELLYEEKLIENAEKMGNYLLEQLKKIQSPLILDIRGKGLLIGIHVNPQYYSARELCLRLMKLGILSKETHHTVIRLAPPLMITQSELDHVIAAISKVFVEANETLLTSTRK